MKSRSTIQPRHPWHLRQPEAVWVTRRDWIDPIKSDFDFDLGGCFLRHSKSQRGHVLRDCSSQGMVIAVRTITDLRRCSGLSCDGGEQLQPSRSARIPRVSALR